MADNGQFSDAEEIVCDVPTTAEEVSHVTTTNSQTTDNNNTTSDNNSITSDKTNYENGKHGENCLNGATVENVDYYEEEWYEEEERLVVLS